MTSEEIGKRRMTRRIGYQVANLLVGVSDEESRATRVNSGKRKRGSVGDEERTGDGREAAVDDGELGALLILSWWKECCGDCHTLTSWDQSEDGVRRVLHLDSSFGVHGGSGKYEYNCDDFTADTEGSRFTSVEETERTDGAIAPGGVVDAEEDRFRFKGGGVNGSDPLMGQSSSTEG